jgi:hypothetical protein
MVELLPTSRAAAIALGKTYYFTGELCSRGHRAKRLTSTSTCLDCQKHYARKFRLKHPERHREKLQRQKQNRESGQNLRELLERFGDHAASRDSNQKRSRP